MTIANVYQKRKELRSDRVGDVLGHHLPVFLLFINFGDVYFNGV